MKIGITGTQYGMTEYQKRTLTEFFASLAYFYLDIDFHHGQCIGVDEESLLIAKEFGFHTVSHPPINESKMSHVESDETREPKYYIPRNYDIVDEVDILFACPLTNHEVLRSGTWTTIR